jgi:hypothetical protein
MAVAWTVHNLPLGLCMHDHISQRNDSLQREELEEAVFDRVAVVGNGLSYGQGGRGLPSRSRPVAISTVVS